MNVIVNGVNKQIEDNTTLDTLVDTISEALPKMFVIEVNKEIVLKDDYKSIALNEGDQIEVVVFCGGG